jgi:hypothetical protein
VTGPAAFGPGGRSVIVHRRRYRCGHVHREPRGGSASECHTTLSDQLGTQADGVCHPIYSTPTNGYDPNGPSPESVGIQGADICAWRAKGISETDIVDHIVVSNSGMITPNVEDWVRKAEQDNCPQKLAELVPALTGSPQPAVPSRKRCSSSRHQPLRAWRQSGVCVHHS